jgi:flagellar biosynthesis protein FliQ
VASRPVTRILTIVMDVLVVVAVCLTIGVVVRFFGTLAGTQVGESYLRFVSVITLPLGLSAVNTPYGGHFDVGAVATVAIVLVIEWALSVARRRA